SLYRLVPAVAHALLDEGEEGRPVVPVDQEGGHGVSLCEKGQDIARKLVQGEQAAQRHGATLVDDPRQQPVVAVVLLVVFGEDGGALVGPARQWLADGVGK